MHQVVEQEPSLWSIREKALLVTIAFALFLAFVIIANYLLPPNCLMFEYRQVGLLCDGLDLSRATQPCPVCENEAGASVARLVALAGTGFLLIPIFVYWMRWWRDRRS